MHVDWGSGLTRALIDRAFGSRFDDGFSLVEVVAALVITMVVMTTTAAFFIKSSATVRLMQQRQAASAVAQQAIERARSKPAALLAVQRDVTLTGGVSATSGTDPAYRVANINYTVRTRITDCWMPPEGGPSCAATQSSVDDLLMYRVDVEVRWTPRANATCFGAGGVCEYSVSTLRDLAGSSMERVKEVPAT